MYIWFSSCCDGEPHPGEEPHGCKLCYVIYILVHLLTKCYWYAVIWAEIPGASHIFVGISLVHEPSGLEPRGAMSRAASIPLAPSLLAALGSSSRGL